MKYLSLVFGFLLFALSTFAQTSTVSLNYDGLQRRFVVHLPTGYTSGDHLPLVINLHGYGLTDNLEEIYTNMDATADANHFVVIYPNGVDSAWNVGWFGAYNTGVDDVGFVSKIIDTANAMFGIDLNRVYACGLSNGGFMSHRLACELSDKIAAVASVAGCLTDSTAFYCNPARRMPVMQIHGTMDPVVAYTGLAGSLSVEATINFWLNRNQCGTTSDTTDLPNTNTSDGSTVQKIDYPACATHGEVLFYKVFNGGHTWPGSPIQVVGYGNTNYDMVASTEIWNFFKHYTLDGTPVGIDQPSLGEQQVLLTPNPASQTVTLQMPDVQNAMGYIYNLSGKLVSQMPLANQQAIDVSQLPNGVYILQLSQGNQLLAHKKLVVLH